MPKTGRLSTMRTCQTTSRRRPGRAAGDHGPLATVRGRTGRGSSVLPRGAGRGPPGPPPAAERPALAARRGAVRRALGPARWAARGRRASRDLPGPAPGHQGRPHRHRVPGAAGDPQRSAAGPAGPRPGHGLPGPGGRRRAAAHPAGYRVAPGPGPAAHRVRPRVDRRVRPRPAARQAVLHQHRLRPGRRDLHHCAAPRHLRRLGRPSGLGDQPAAGADPPRRDRGHGHGRPAHAR